MEIPVICIVGAHNSGKTTFITKIINILTSEGYNVVTLKHDPKGKAVTDTVGKDSYKMYESGAKQVILVSPKKITTYNRVKKELHPKEIIDKFSDKEADIIILEGFKWFKGFDKFEVIRKVENRDLMLKDSEELKGVITDYYPFNPSFDINKPEQFVEFLKNNYLND